MQVSRFNFLVPSTREPKVKFLYNSFHDNRIAVEEDGFQVENLFCKVNNREQLTESEQDAAEGLKKLGFLLDDGADEKQLFKSWMNNKIKNQNDLLTITVVTSMACNLRCVYCFEQEKLRSSRMSSDIIEQTVKWIETRIDSSRPGKVNVVFFGGEPLLNIEAIRKISGNVSTYCKKRDIRFSSGAITNGIFLTPKLVDELKTYGFSWVKITLDGDQPFHDKKRIYSDGRGSFEKVFSNLESVAGKLKILIGGNFDKENVDSFQSLLNKLSQSNFRDDIITVGFQPIIVEMADDGRNVKKSSCERCNYDEYQVQKMNELREEVRQAGFGVDDVSSFGPCEFYRRDAVTIGVDGKIYKCGLFVDQKGTDIGHVSSQSFNTLGEDMLDVSKPFENEKCSQCPFPPICGGGCRADSFNNTGDFHNISCKQDFFKSTLTRDLPLEFYGDAQTVDGMGDV